MKKNCESCKHWNHKSVATLSSGHKFAECLAPLPFWVNLSSDSDRNPLNTDGEYCATFNKEND